MGRTYTYQFIVREKNLDSFGHMNNAEYLTFFEEARWDWVESIGMGYDKIKESGFGFVVLEINLRFMKELKLRDIVTIKCDFQSFKGKVGVIHQVMMNEANLDCCEATFKVGFFDAKKRTLVKPSKEFIEGFELH